MKPHAYVRYLFAFTFVAFVMCVLYVYFTDKHTSVEDDKEWFATFAGIDSARKEIDSARKGIDSARKGIPLRSELISHDDDEWFYQGKPVCVAYGDWTQPCIRNQYFCAGGIYVGNAQQQANAVYHAIVNGGTHPDCPLL